MRVVDDIVVTGSVGAYPLKWTRYFNSHLTYSSDSVGGKWRFSYRDYSYPGATFPDGRVLSDDYGVEDHVGSVNGKTAIFMADGGKVIFNLYMDGTQPNYYPSEIWDPYGQITRLTHRTATVNGKLHYLLDRVTEPGGRYLKINWDAANSNITSVQAFDGVNSQPMQSVTYTWSTFPLNWNVMPSTKVISRVDYSDGTFATYTYTDQAYPGPPTCDSFPQGHWHAALLKTADDVRYPGPMRQIAYKYYTTGNKTRISSENHLVNGVASEAVSTISGVSSANSTTNATETRGDGAQRNFFYYSVPRVGDCTGQEPPEIAPTDGKLYSCTDFQGHPTTLTYETDATKASAGFITAVKDANNNITTYTRSSLSWAILRITHPDGNHIDETY